MFLVITCYRFSFPDMTIDIIMSFEEILQYDFGCVWFSKVVRKEKNVTVYFVWLFNKYS